MKLLANSLKLKGTGLPGLTSNLIQRTDRFAWYLRSDGYHEVFIIRTGKTFDGSGTTEYYPGYTNFGVSAWCIGDPECAARYYENLCLGQPVDSRMDTERNSDIIRKNKRKIRPSQIKTKGDEIHLIN
jgi:hypothetical protein